MIDSAIESAFNTDRDKKPELTETEREIVERRNRYGERTTIDRPARDGSWIYDSKSDDWRRDYDPTKSLP